MTAACPCGFETWSLAAGTRGEVQLVVHAAPFVRASHRARAAVMRGFGNQEGRMSVGRRGALAVIAMLAVAAAGACSPGPGLPPTGTLVIHATLGGSNGALAPFGDRGMRVSRRGGSTVVVRPTRAETPTSPSCPASTSCVCRASRRSPEWAVRPTLGARLYRMLSFRQTSSCGSSSTMRDETPTTHGVGGVSNYCEKWRRVAMTAPTTLAKATMSSTMASQIAGNPSVVP